MDKHPVRASQVQSFIESVVGTNMHAKRVLSLTNATLGAVHAASLAVHSIGLALAQARGLQGKHAIKQVDRLLSNSGFNLWRFFASWVPFMVRGRSEIVVALDWTDFDADDQATIALSLVTNHGRAAPLMWMTVFKSLLANSRNRYEDELLERFREVLPAGVKVTLLADRGFGDTKLYEYLTECGFDFVIRFRSSINVTDAKGETRTAAEWVPSTGRPKLLRDAAITNGNYRVSAVVCVQARDMKDAWCLASSRGDLPASAIVQLYGRRFTVEEGFRDIKDLRFGMGLSSTHIGAPDRRDRMLLLGALANTLITLLGAAGENVGLDRMLKANTAKKRTHSLLRQGFYYYGAIPNMRESDLTKLIEAFGKLIEDEPALAYVFSTK